MKKTLLATFALAAIAAGATPFVNYNRVLVPAGKVQMAESATPVQTAKAPQKIANVDQLVGEYVSIFSDMAGSPYQEASHVTIAKGTQAGTITLKGLFAETNDYITAVVDAANDKFSIAPGQVVYTSETYGKCNIYKVTAYDETNGATIDKNANIEGEIVNGKLNITSAWLAMLSEGQYAGQYFVPIHQNEILAKANGKMDFKNSKNVDISASVLITEENDTEITVANFGGYGVVVKMLAAKDSTVTIAQQAVLDGGQEQGVFSTSDVVGNEDPGDGIISCKGTENEIKMTEHWTLSAPTGYWFGKLQPAKFTFTDGSVFTYPHDSSAVTNVSTSKSAVSKTYVNLAGVQSNMPFAGVNMVITRYNDGSVQTVKVIK